MTRIDGIAGMYNLLIEEDFDIADHRIPIESFIEMLDEQDLPDDIAVSGLDNALLDNNEDLITDLTVAMREQRDWLDSRDPLPVIQFVFDGDFQNTGDSFELLVDGQLYALTPVFGRNIRRQESGWLVTSYRV